MNVRIQLSELELSLRLASSGRIRLPLPHPASFNKVIADSESKAPGRFKGLRASPEASGAGVGIPVRIGAWPGGGDTTSFPLPRETKLGAVPA